LTFEILPAPPPPYTHTHAHTQGVHMMFEGVPDRKWRPEEKRNNRMVFIGKDLNKEDFAEAFRGCLATVKEVQAEVA